MANYTNQLQPLHFCRMTSLLLPNFSVRSSGGFPSSASSRGRGADTRGAELVNHIWLGKDR